MNNVKAVYLTKEQLTAILDCVNHSCVNVLSDNGVLVLNEDTFNREDQQEILSDLQAVVEIALDNFDDLDNREFDSSAEIMRLEDTLQQLFDERDNIITQIACTKLERVAAIYNTALTEIDDEIEAVKDELKLVQEVNRNEKSQSLKDVYKNIVLNTAKANDLAFDGDSNMLENDVMFTISVGDKKFNMGYCADAYDGIITLLEDIYEARFDGHRRDLRY